MSKKVIQKEKIRKVKLKIKLFSLEGKEIDKINVSAEIFGQQVRPKLVAQAIRVYLANQRRAHSKTKTRGEVSGSRRKIWKQKGTGRARHGDRYAPIFVGGGVAHGPTGSQNWQLKMPKKMRRRALFSLLSDKLAKERIIAASLEKIEPKTKAAALFLEKAIKENNQKVLLLISKKGKENISRSFANLPKVKMAYYNQLNAYRILNSDWLIFEENALSSLEKYWLEK
ncbi:MAG: 50S ribosomal protein L4 [Candidatus Shapirobacteria bacterium]